MKKLIALFCFFLPAVVLAQAASQPTLPSTTDWQGKLLDVVGSLLMTALTFLAGKAIAYFNAHEKSALSIYVANTFANLAAAALTSVQAVEQIAQRDLAQGITKASAVTLKQDAVNYLKSQLGLAGLAKLASIVGADQVATVLNTHVEAAVLQVNQTEPPKT